VRAFVDKAVVRSSDSSLMPVEEELEREVSSDDRMWNLDLQSPMKENCATSPSLLVEIRSSSPITSAYTFVDAGGARWNTPGLRKRHKVEKRGGIVGSRLAPQAFDPHLQFSKEFSSD